MKRLVPALLISFSALAFGLSAAASPEAVALDLSDGRLSPSRAAEAWAKAGLSPEEAHGLVQELLPVDRSPRGARNQSATLEDALGRTSEVLIQVPAKPLSDGRYGVLVILHGLGGKAEQLMPFGTKIAPPGWIVVSPTARKLAHAQENEDLPEWGAAISSRLPHWWSYRDTGFPLLALDHVKRTYPVDTNRVALAGYSMGGYGTWNIGLRHHDRFCALVPMAGGLSRTESVLPRDPRSRPLLRNAVMVPSWFTHGNADGTVPVRFSRTISEELRELGASHVYREVEAGRHIMMPFLRGNDLTRELVTWLRKQVRDPNPTRVSHSLVGTYHGSAYWLRVDTMQGKNARAAAEVKAGNTIEVTTEGVEKITVFLDSDLVNVDAEVTIRVNGGERFRGKVEPSLKAVAESYAHGHDPELTYSHSVSLDLN